LFRIKICGVTSAKDAQLIALAGADAIGLNFYPNSPRYIEPLAAEKMAPTISPKLARVGVFVNSPVDFLLDTAARLNLDWIQLHGDETPEIIAALAGRAVIKVFRFQVGAWETAGAYLQQCRNLGTSPAAVMVDAAQPGEYGGTGQTIDWGLLAEGRPVLAGLPFVLAGGLTPFNVVDAVSIAKPDAVDVASGVESKPGTKDLMLIRAFVTSAKKAFEAAGK
jgi:phosphoribosylanthranilate isomerase